MPTLSHAASKERRDARRAIVAAANRVKRSNFTYRQRHLQRCVKIVRARRAVSASTLQKAGFRP